jgi:hypothetical protein
VNSCEDQTEPLGEAPEVVALPSDATSNLRFAAIAIAEIRELHRAVPDTTVQVCDCCWIKAPCATVQILDKWGV